MGKITKGEFVFRIKCNISEKCPRGGYENLFKNYQSMLLIIENDVNHILSRRFDDEPKLAVLLISKFKYNITYENFLNEGPDFINITIEYLRYNYYVEFGDLDAVIIDEVTPYFESILGDLVKLGNLSDCDIIPEFGANIHLTKLDTITQLDKINEYNILPCSPFTIAEYDHMKIKTITRLEEIKTSKNKIDVRFEHYTTAYEEYTNGIEDDTSLTESQKRELIDNYYNTEKGQAFKKVKMLIKQINSKLIEYDSLIYRLDNIFRLLKIEDGDPLPPDSRLPGLLGGGEDVGNTARRLFEGGNINNKYDDQYRHKYLKYKNKYLQLKNKF